MQESMQDVNAAEPEFHRCNSENHRLVNQKFSKNRPELQAKIRISQLTFIPGSITIFSFFWLHVLRRQHDYVLTFQKRASDWLKISRRFFGLLPFKTEMKFKVLRKKWQKM